MKAKEALVKAEEALVNAKDQSLDKAKEAQVRPLGTIAKAKLGGVEEG